MAVGTGGEGRGWRRWALALLSGALLASAFPPLDWWPVAFLGLLPLLVAAAGEPPARAAWLGFASGMAFALLSIPWVVVTMVRYGQMPVWGAGGVLLALAAYLACYPAAFTFALSRFPLPPAAFPVGAAALWTALEYLRTYALSGFPWNLLGYSQLPNLPFAQVATVTGVYGISFLLVLASAAAAAPLLPGASPRGVWGTITAAGLLIGAAHGAGLWALRGADAAAPAPLRVGVVQGNIEQALKWSPAALDLTLDTYSRLSAQAAAAGADLIVWPETAAPLLLRHDPVRLAYVRALAQSLGRPVLVGAPDRAAGEPIRLQNSAMLFGPDGRLLAKYDKMHLVPFGEYVPLKPLLFFVDKVATGIGDFVPGESRTVFGVPGGTFAASICFEVIFPAEVRAAVAGGAEFLVNITNDAWFGRSAAPAQHLRMAAFRALETRRYLARAANTGISAAVDPYGRVLRSTGLFEEAVLVEGVRPRRDLTPYVRFGDWFAAAASLAAAGWMLRAWAAERRAAGRGETGWRT
ncbi:MAG: apolipoprotein N-acyltransferase [candidate division NC10 bacterium]|nr:apolipoprotein N-acyltransferase [candidate division NC10 bacterium]